MSVDNSCESHVCIFSRFQSVKKTKKKKSGGRANAKGTPEPTPEFVFKVKIFLSYRLCIKINTASKVIYYTILGSENIPEGR